MKLGSYEVPEMRLVPTALADVKKIYDIVKTEPIGTKEIGNVFGYKQTSTGVFYRRMGTMLSYGLLTALSRSTFKVTDLAVALCYPEPDKEPVFKNKAILGVPLWNEIFKKFGRKPLVDNFWIQLKNITGIEPVEAQKIQNVIRKWYLDDISLVKLDPLGHPITDQGIGEHQESNNQTQPQDLSFSKPKGNTVSQQLVSPQPDQEKLEFGKAVLLLPKNDLKKEWEKLQKYMQIFLEDYEEPVVKSQEELAPESKTN